MPDDAIHLHGGLNPLVRRFFELMEVFACEWAIHVHHQRNPALECHHESVLHSEAATAQFFSLNRVEQWQGDFSNHAGDLLSFATVHAVPFPKQPRPILSPRVHKSCRDRYDLCFDLEIDINTQYSFAVTAYKETTSQSSPLRHCSVREVPVPNSSNAQNNVNAGEGTRSAVTVNSEGVVARGSGLNSVATVPLRQKWKSETTYLGVPVRVLGLRRQSDFS